MGDWWNSFDTLMKVLFTIATASTVILIIQMIAAIFGFGGDGSGDGVDVDTDVEADMSDGGIYEASDAPDQGGWSDLDVHGLQIFSIRGILSFFAIGGWVTLILLSSNVHYLLSIGIGVVCGFLSMVAVALMMRKAMQLQASGNINLRSAIGLIGEVYLTIPPKGEGHGKVTLMLEERYREYDAVNNTNEKIATGSSVRITDIISPDTVVVEKE